jgi:hypothetical protein
MKNITINIGISANGKMVDICRQATLPYSPEIITLIDAFVGYMAAAANVALDDTGLYYSWEPATPQDWKTLERKII